LPSEITFDREILVPFPPESQASGVGHTAFLPVVWYRRSITGEDIARAGTGPRLLLHFGAVDYEADVWLGGTYLGRHQGGQTPFSFDVTGQAVAGAEIVVRAIDEPADTRQPRGKQDWREEPHSIWYHRTTGIWQPVWLESVPDLHVSALHWSCDTSEARVEAVIELAGWVAGTAAEIEIELRSGEQLLAKVRQTMLSAEQRVVAAVPALEDGQQARALLWSPETPVLIDARVVLRAGDSVDEIESYLGLRSVGVADREFLLNGHPYYLRSVLEQGYWPKSHLAATADELRTEVELIKALGFNAVRIHQKVEDPRFLYWCDRLGLAVWGEIGNAYTFSPIAVQRLVAEWMQAVQRDRSHPSIVAWVPINESWGVQQGGVREREQQYGRSLAALTRALDPTRPVISNDGWEHIDSDIVTIHDYAHSGEVLTDRYEDEEHLARTIARRLPAGRKIWLNGETPTERPVMLTEFGGIKLVSEGEQGWGYTAARDPESFERLLKEVVGAVRRSTILSGYCYTQLTDTLQEVNGLLREDRTPKLPMSAYQRVFGNGS
jgi:beta-galactosidase/beta-glucuronidase